MARTGVYVVDRVVQEQIKGGINLKENLWYIPIPNFEITAGLQ